MTRMRSKKAFTIIELIVVIAIIGVLILLAMPKLLGYVEKTRITLIKNDVKSAENLVDAELTINSDLGRWGNSVDVDIDALAKENRLYDIRGLVTEESVIIDRWEKEKKDDYWQINNRDIKSRLRGSFYVNLGGKVYYVDKQHKNNNNESNNQDSLVILKSKIKATYINSALDNHYIEWDDGSSLFYPSHMTYSTMPKKVYEPRSNDMIINNLQMSSEGVLLFFNDDKLSSLIRDFEPHGSFSITPREKLSKQEIDLLESSRVENIDEYVFKSPEIKEAVDKLLKDDYKIHTLIDLSDEDDESIIILGFNNDDKLISSKISIYNSKVYIDSTVVDMKVGVSNKPTDYIQVVSNGGYKLKYDVSGMDIIESKFGNYKTIDKISTFYTSKEYNTYLNYGVLYKDGGYKVFTTSLWGDNNGLVEEMIIDDLDNIKIKDIAGRWVLSEDGNLYTILRYNQKLIKTGSNFGLTKQIEGIKMIDDFNLFVIMKDEVNQVYYRGSSFSEKEEYEGYEKNIISIYEEENFNIEEASRKYKLSNNNDSLTIYGNNSVLYSEVQTLDISNINETIVSISVWGSHVIILTDNGSVWSISIPEREIN